MSKWMRVSADRKCLVCGKDHWCTYTSCGSVSKCPRVQSDRYTEGGYIHFHRELGTPEPRAVWEPQPLPDCDEQLTQKWNRMHESTTTECVRSWASCLGVSADALNSIQVAEERDDVLAFPMRRLHKGVVGIRYRAKNGKKWAEKGKRAGLFLPTGFRPDPNRILMIAEGPTDTAALLTLGFLAIGRPSAMGCERMIVEACHGFKAIVIWADNDDVGYNGAAELLGRTPPCPIGRFIVTPEAKDIREWVRSGATRREVIEHVIRRTGINRHANDRRHACT